MLNRKCSNFNTPLTIQVAVTQSNHIFAAMIASRKLEILPIKENSNHFALKSRLYVNALKTAFDELQLLKQFQLKLKDNHQSDSVPLSG